VRSTKGKLLINTAKKLKTIDDEPQKKSPFRKPYKVNFKEHDQIQRMFEINANAEVKMLDRMQ
jgi:hypothetical protein